MILDWPALAAAFLLGLFSSAHCLGMCGGIMGALSMAVPASAQRRRLWLLLCYNLGRLASYSLMGLLVGLFAAQLAAWGALVWLRWLAGLLLIAMGLYLASWWRGLTYLETGGRYLWAYLQPIGKALMPVDSAIKGLALGAIWGWLPCGLVYSALAYAMAQGTSLGGGAIMLAFGVGTLPALLATGLAAQQLARLLQQVRVRQLLALLIIAFGLWTLWGGGHNLGGHGHHDSHSPVVHGHDHTDSGHIDSVHGDAGHAAHNAASHAQGSLDHEAHAHPQPHGQHEGDLHEGEHQGHDHHVGHSSSDQPATPVGDSQAHSSAADDHSHHHH